MDLGPHSTILHRGEFDGAMSSRLGPRVVADLLVQSRQLVKNGLGKEIHEELGLRLGSLGRGAFLLGCSNGGTVCGFRALALDSARFAVFCVGALLGCRLVFDTLTRGLQAAFLGTRLAVIRIRALLLSGLDISCVARRLCAAVLSRRSCRLGSMLRG